MRLGIFKIIAIYSALLLGICFFPSCSNHMEEESVGYIISNSELGNLLYLSAYDLKLLGVDKNGVTYFLLPSYITMTAIDQSLSPNKLLMEDGSLLTAPPEYGIPQAILVDTGETQLVPWNICFLKSENLYTIHINTDGAGIGNIDHDIYSNMSVSVISEKGIPELINAEVLIKGRGNTSWVGGKKPYELKFNDAVSLCDMQPAKKWVLLANYFDATKMNNKLAFDLSEAIGLDYSIESDWVDLYADEVYLGNYLLCKEPDIGRHNLDIGNLESINSNYLISDAAFDSGSQKGYLYNDSPSPLSGGYLIEKDTSGYYDESPCGFVTSHNYFTLKSPNNASEEQISYIGTFVKDLDSLLRENSDEALSKIDEATFTRRYIVEEIMYNYDAFITSYFFYKKPYEDKLYAGPVWDYDQAMGELFLDYNDSILDNHLKFETEGTNTMIFKNPLDWDNILYENAEYKKYLIDIFTFNVPVFKDFIENRMDSYYNKIEKSIKMDYIVWGRGWGAGHYEDPYNNFRYAKFFLAKRLEYLCKRWNINLDFSYDFSETENHVITLLTPSGIMSEMTVPDGAQIKPDDLPSYDNSIYQGWYYINPEHHFSYFVPIYEDVSVQLLPVSE